MDQAVTDRISHSRIGDHLMPFGYRELRSHDGRVDGVSVFKQFQQDQFALFLNRVQAEVVNDGIPSVNPIFPMSRRMRKLNLRKPNTEVNKDASHYPESQTGEDVQAGKGISCKRPDPERILPET